MKYIAMIVMLMAASVASADKVRLSAVESVETVCLDGYLFAVARSNVGISITQVMRESNTMVVTPPQPVECK